MSIRGFAGAFALVFLVYPLEPAGSVQAADDAPAGLDGTTNGFVGQDDFDTALDVFSETDDVEEGIGPVFNATGCVECHATPVTGGVSQVTELRIGHLNASGAFENPSIAIGGDNTIANRSLVNDRTICTQITQRVPSTETVRALRNSLNLLGDGFVEAIPDDALTAVAKAQCDQRDETGICGQAIQVALLEAPGQTRVGRFGWKDQHASLLSFSADAYVNEMGITSDLIPADVTPVCDEAADPEDVDQNVPSFATFMRSTQPTPREPARAMSAASERGAALFEQIGCASCHVPTFTTLPAGASINAGQLTVPAALGDKVIHPFGDFLLHDVGTGDGIAQPPEDPAAQDARNKLRTPPLWGVRFREPRLMHDGQSSSFSDAIGRHAGEASKVIEKFNALGDPEQADLMEFLRSL